MGILSRLVHTFEKDAGPGSPAGPGSSAGRSTKGVGRWLVYGVAAVILLWAMGYVWKGVSASDPPFSGSPPSSVAGDGAARWGPGGTPSPAPAEEDTGNARQYERALARELEGLLCEVQGAGRVRVVLTLARGPVYVFGTNTSEDTRTTQEQDGDGMTRTVTEVSTTREPVIVSDGSQAERPLVMEEERPEVSGVVVLAEGAGDSRVRLDLVRAVQALFPLPTHRITVLPMGR